VAEGPELTELLLDKRGTPGLVSVHPGQVQDRYIEELKHTAAQQLPPAVAEVVPPPKCPTCRSFSTSDHQRWPRDASILASIKYCELR
jgi:2,6-dihydroxypyridine 3-monooxygenase